MDMRESREHMTQGHSLEGKKYFKSFIYDDEKTTRALSSVDLKARCLLARGMQMASPAIDFWSLLC